MRLRHFAALAALAAACGDPPINKLTLEAQPPEVPADGISFTLIKITAQESSRPVPDGTTISLETDDGSFDQDDPDVKETSKSVIAGSGQVTLFSPTAPHDATVRGTFTTQSGRTINGEATVKFREPTLAGRLAFNCTSRNIGTLVDGVDDGLWVPCTAKAFDANDVEITRPNILFLAEAGKVEWVEDDFTHERIVIYKPRIGGSEPANVDPLGSTGSGEPRWSDPNSGGRVRNPRDGVAALVAWVRGIPPGGRDVQGEPFVDVNDNGDWDADEPYHDCNGNLHYDAPTGASLDKGCLWRTFKVVWTGKSCFGSPCPAALASRIELQSQIVPCGGSVDFTVKLVDENLNALAANDPEDDVQMDLAANGASVPGPLLRHSMKSTAGMFFNTTGVDGYLELIRDVDKPTGYSLETSYSSQIVSENPQGANSIFTVGIIMTRTLGPPNDGQSAPDLNSEPTPTAQGQVAGNCPQ